MAAEIKLEGFDELTAKLKAIPAAMRKRVIRNALAAGARLVRNEARKLVPVLSPAAALKAPYRTPGTVKKAINVRTSKQSRRSGDIGVFVNVRPAKAGQRGAKSKTDPFYWRFLEFGTKNMKARPYLQTAADKLPEALDLFKASVTKWIEKTNTSGKVAP